MSVKRRFEVFQHPKVNYCQCIRIRNGRYKGLVIHYGRVAMPILDDGRAKLEFHFTVVDNPRGHDTKEKMLHKLLGDILVELLDEELSRDYDTISRLSITDIEEIAKKDIEIGEELD